MPRTGRVYSNSGHYHVIMRGVERRTIFKDDFDREYFIAKLTEICDDMSISIIAYCLMTNHVHLLLYDSKDNLSRCMQRLGTCYVMFFNAKYDRVGHLFQNRFNSRVIIDDFHFLNVIKYIHNNPEKAGISLSSQYTWSSFQTYCDDEGITCRELLYSMIGGKKEFKSFSEVSIDYEIEFDEALFCREITSDEIVAFAKKVMYDSACSNLKEMDKQQRNEILRKLRNHGFSIRQIEEITGISRGIIQRC